MYTVSKGPSKIVAKTRRGLSQNYEKFETIKESGKRTLDLYSPEKNNVPRPVFQTSKKASTHTQKIEEEVITPQHEEIIRYINDSWNIVVARNPYDTACISNDHASASAVKGSSADSASSVYSSSTCSSTCTSPPTSPQPTATAAALYCVEPPSPVLSDFKPFDLESWWGRRLFNNITKSL